jgi:Bardet-Biedl syndrome 1 protein
MKGKPLWSVKMPANISTIELLDYKNKGVLAVLVALSNSEVHTYVDKNHVDTIITEDTVCAMKYGRFGREDQTLVMVTKGGGLIVKMLKRTAQFDNSLSRVGPPLAQSQKLDIPKKTKLFLDQTVRERESGTDIYRQFQHDLYRLRLQTTRGYAAVLQNSMTPISVLHSEPVKLHVEVTGIGPLFRLSIHIQNTSLSLPCVDLFVAFDCDHQLYELGKPSIMIPLLVPGLNYVFDCLVRCLCDKGISDLIKVFVLKKNVSAPVITAVINMPISEPSTG